MRPDADELAPLSPIRMGEHILEALDPARLPSPVRHVKAAPDAPQGDLDWRSQGRTVRLVDMTPDHLWHAIQWCRRQDREATPIYAALVAELTRREGRVGLIRRAAERT